MPMLDPQKVFKVERHGDVLVVLPQGPALDFRYQEVHLESNALYRVVDEPQLKHVVVDLGCVSFVDSVIISSILRVLTRVKQRGGKAVFCCGSENMQSILKCIKIGKLWPHFDTREQAIEYVHS